jgi:hypothetical protein
VSNIKLSILIPSIPSRFDKMKSLYNRLLIECEKLPIEILCLVDNKKRSIGEKRDALVQIAKGQYLTILDDDDNFFEGYAKEIIDAINLNYYFDIITFTQKATIDGKSFLVDFSLAHKENEELKLNDEGEYSNIKRLPFHCCIWKTSIAQSERFASVNFGEDWDWCKRLIPKCKTEYKINKVLHHYIFNSQTTEASTESNEVWVNPNN